MKSYWRKRCIQIIADVLKKQLPEKEERNELIKAYPFGEKKRWPYQIWLDEIKRQKGLKPPLYNKVQIVDKNQQKLF